MTAKFTKTRDERVVEFRVRTSAKVTSYRGTRFVPNHVRARIDSGQIVSLSLEKLDMLGMGMDDPAGPDGAELNADFGPSQLESDLPQVAQDALDAVKWAIR